jgi:hypothetical protein
MEEPYYDKFQCYKLQEGYFSDQGRFYADYNPEKLDPLFLSGWPSKTSERLSVSNIRPDDVAISSGLSSVFRRFKLFKIVTIWTTWQHVRTLFRVREDSSATVRAMWQYCPDASQSSRRIRFFFADTYMGRQLHL